MPVKPYVGTIADDTETWSAQGGDGYIFATRIIANMSVIATSIGALVACSDENMKLALYDHNSGDNEPENLLGYSGIITNSAEFNTPEWTFSNLNTPVYLERGTYYWAAIMFQYGTGETGSDAMRYFHGSTTDKRLCRLFADYWPDYPDPFGTPSQSINNFSPNLHFMARGDLDITPSPVARNKDADW